MAEKLASEIIREFLVCQICLDDYRQPKVLPCLHTFCRRCLERMVGNRGRVSCPTCRQEAAVYESGVAGLKDNFFVGKLRDMVRNSAQPTGPERRPTSGSACRRCGYMSKATKYRHSDDSDDFLCESCNESRRRTRSPSRRKMHSSSPREIRRNGPSVQGVQDSAGISRSAQGNNDIVYCKSCHDFICRKNSLSKHRARLHSQAVEAAEREKSEVRALLAEAEKVAAAHEKKLQELNTRREVWQQQCEENVAKIEEQARRAIQTIQVERDERIKELRRVETTKNRQLLENLAAVATSAARVRDSCTFARETIENGNPEEALAVAKEVKERLSHCSKLRPPSFS